MNRREVLRFLGSTGIAGTFWGLSSTRASGQTPVRYEAYGSGPAVMALGIPPPGYFDQLTDRYRVVAMDYPPRDSTQAFIDSFTADRVCADILAVADTAGVDRFAWYGFSWGGVVGLQLAARTTRLTALVCGGWPPLGGPYRETLEIALSQPRNPFATYYRSLETWAEQDTVSRLTCPRMTFAGVKDQFVAPKGMHRIGPLIAEHREELERMGWTVRLVEGFGHELGGRPDVVMPLIREFLDPLLLN